MYLLFLCCYDSNAHIFNNGLFSFYVLKFICYMVSIKVFCKRKQETKEVIWCFPSFEGVGRLITMDFIFHFVSLPRQICLVGGKVSWFQLG